MFRTAVAALLAVSLAAVPASAESWDEVVAAAKKEGSILIYHSLGVNASYLLPVLRSFEAKYGITVTQVSGRASEIAERIRTEQATGHYGADVEFHSDSTIGRQREAGYTQPIGAVPNTANLRDPFTVTENGIPAWGQYQGMLVNTDMVKPEDEPKTWHDILDPKWKNRMMMDDPRALGPSATLFFTSAKKYGLGFFEKLKAQNPVLSRDTRVTVRDIAQGRFPLTPTQSFAIAYEFKGLPIKVLAPEDGCPYTLIRAIMLRGAKYPNAVRVFMNHFLEQDSQIHFGKAWWTPVVDGVMERIEDPDTRRLLACKSFGATNSAEQQKYLDLATKMFAQ